MGKQIAGQLSIFDWMPSVLKYDAFPDINDISEEEAVRIVSENVGLPFAYRDEFWGWQAKKGKAVIRLKYGKFRVPNFEKFLGVDIWTGTSGMSSPCDGVESAIKAIKRWIGGQET